MINNYWLDEAEKEDVAYFRNNLFKPLVLPLCFEEAKVCAKKHADLGLLNNLSPEECFRIGWQAAGKS